MKLPSRIVDISQPLDNDTLVDPPFMRPHIDYVTGRDNTAVVCDYFPGLKEDDLPGGEGWAIEYVKLATHNGTHVDAPYHFNSLDARGNRMQTIDEMPLDWFFRPGVKLDFRHFHDGYVATAADVEAELARVGYTLQPMDIVLVNTRAGEAYGTEEYIHAGCGMGRDATLYLTERGVRVTGIDGWSWDAPFSKTRERWMETQDPMVIWEGHYAGKEIPYCHLEKMRHLEQLPAFGFTVACFPCKIARGSAGWTRAVALFD
ncbi:MAG: cyclase family protein [Gammaproteobacteria bacterium]|nr:cyclase family protein [Gammaproteobacteria bacterium]